MLLVSLMRTYGVFLYDVAVSARGKTRHEITPLARLCPPSDCSNEHHASPGPHLPWTTLVSCVSKSAQECRSCRTYISMAPAVGSCGRVCRRNASFQAASAPPQPTILHDSTRKTGPANRLCSAVLLTVARQSAPRLQATQDEPSGRISRTRKDRRSEPGHCTRRAWQPHGIRSPWRRLAGPCRSALHTWA